MDGGMDLLQGIQDAQAPDPSAPIDFGDPSAKLPSMEQILEMIEGMDMPDGDKEQLKDSLLNKGNLLKNIPSNFAKRFTEEQQIIDPKTQFIVFFLAFAIVTCIFVKMGEPKTKEDYERLIQERIDEFTQKLEGYKSKLSNLDFKLKEYQGASSSDDSNSIISSDYYTGCLIIIAAILLITIFVFFGYKLYKSLTEKERRKQEKKKQKQQKKKK